MGFKVHLNLLEKYCAFEALHGCRDIRRCLNPKIYPRILLEVAVSGDRYGYKHRPKRTVYPTMVTCHQARGLCSFGLVTVTIYVPGDTVLSKEYGDKFHVYYQ